LRPDLACDFAVVGSGAGGSVVAYHLARAGERVVVIERGRSVRPEEMGHDELRMLATLYKDGGTQMNNEADFYVLQGQCVGGSTVLTNAVCFRMPEEVRQGFASRGFEIPRADLDESYARVEGVLNVRPLDDRLWSPASHRLADGMRALGIEPGTFRKSLLHCIGCGFCNMGCRYGRKLDASTTWIPMARGRGAELVTEAEALRIERRRDRVTALLCRDVRDGTLFRVRAERYVLCGGAINTPELLLRSGIRPDRAGRRTSFNAGTIMFAEYDEDVDGFDGDQMCVHHAGDGYLIEQLHNPPMSFAVTMPGSFDRHHADLRRYRRLASAGVLVPTAPAARVFLGAGYRLFRRAFDHADIAYRMGASDVARLREGLKMLARIYLASGARRVLAPAANALEIRRPEEVDLLDHAIRTHEDIPSLGSSHPFGGASLGDDERRDVVDPEFRVRGVRNLFAADASIFPASVRVNPMLSIMAAADYGMRWIGGFRPTGPVDEGPAFDARRAARAAC
jgi:choline dehydrogenase-like flavoprotein